MDKRSTLKSSKDIINYLADTYPNCFSKTGEAKPLKIGIFHDLVGRLGDDSSISKVRLRSALRSYTLSWRYLHGIKADAERVDLDGNCCGTLTAEHVKHAQQQLKESKEKLKEKRQQKQKEEALCGDKEPAKAPKKIKMNTAQSVVKKMKKTPTVTRVPVPVDIANLKIGAEVKVLLTDFGTKPVKAIVIAIEKGNIRLETLTGWPLIVKPENIIQ